MRYFIISILSLFFIFEANAQQVKNKVGWYTFEEAVELATVNPKKIFIDIYTDWCGFCKRMDSETFSNADVAMYLNENFYPVKFNSETKDTIYFQGHMFVNEGEGRRSAHQLSIALLQGKMSYPSIVYLNEDLELLTAVPGFMTPSGIEPILRYFAEDHFLRKSWEDFHKDFKGTF